MTLGEEVWITAAVDDDTAIKALVLGRSLRRSGTSRKIAVIVAKPVSDKFRTLLGSEFDQVLRQDKMGSLVTTEMNGLPLSIHAKLMCWGLPFVKHVVFLHPNHFVVQNSDELFELESDGSNLAFEGSSVLRIKPDLDLFEEILGAVRDRKIHSGDLMKAEAELAAWLNKRGALTNLSAGEGSGSKFCVPISSKGPQLALNEDQISIVHFLDWHPMGMGVKGKRGVVPEHFGLVEKAVINQWRQIFEEDVQPRVNPTNGVIPAPGLPTIFSGKEEPVAIIGMSCRFPGANSVQEYWDLLLEGRDCIQKVPEHRWPSAKGAEYREVQAGFLKCPVDTFDGKFFGISPADLMNTDPQQRLLMEVVWEALEDAGINPQRLKGTPTGVFTGSWTTDYRDLINDRSTSVLDTELAEFHRLYMGNSLGGMGGRLAFLLGLTGPNVATESGCSSGMVAIYLATESLRAGRCGVAIAGGVNLLLHPFKRKHMQSIIAPDGRCKTFDERADGFGRGEGVASLILKKYSDAVRDGDKVWGLIRGTGISQEGTSRSFGTPTKECQELAMRTALINGGLEPWEVCAVEAHGTGTMVGDPVEMAAITSVYSKGRTTPLIVASGKTNIGHTESCSGFAGIIKVILSMQHNMIPPHLHLEKVNPHINLDAIPAIVPLKPLEWKAGSHTSPRCVGVSSFGITGTDAHIILQEPPTDSHPTTTPLCSSPRPLHILALSSKSESGLEAVLETYSAFLEANPGLEFANVAYTANKGRAHFPYRVAIVAKDSAEAVKKFKTLKGSSKHIPEQTPPLCFLFTGQGSQYEGMASALYQSCPTFRLHFDQCALILKTKFGIDLNPVIWPTEGTPTSGGSLKDSLYSQTSIFSVEYALSQLWMSWGLRPQMVLGHSLGEFGAAVVAGFLSLEDALTLVGERSRLIQNKTPEGAMLVVKGDREKVAELEGDFWKSFKGLKAQAWLDLAAVNSKEQTVLAGPPTTVAEFSAFLNQRGVKNTVLEAKNAFHSRDMDPILEEYGRIAKGVEYRRPVGGIQYISGLRGEVVERMDASYWVDHTREGVAFLGASHSAWNQGGRVFLEVGPQPVLSALTMGNVSDLGTEELTFVPSLRRKEADWTTILGSLAKLYVAGYTIDWGLFDQFYGRSRIPSLPFHPFNRKSYWYNQGREGEGGGGGLMFSSENVLHPLIGHAFPNATPIKIYQGGVTPDKFPYLKDHCIGDKVIFPGAGYLEMCLAAGNASTSIQLEGERVSMCANPVSISNLTIHAPLSVGGPVQLQTTADTTTGTETALAVYTSRGGKWFTQATASFCPLPMTYTPEEGVISGDSLSAMLERLTPADIDINQFYDKLAEVGLQFGPIFRSIKQISKGGERELICEIGVPEGSEEYLLHPVILDALIQSIMVGMGRKMDALFVPISIGRLVVFAPISEGVVKLYSHCHWGEESSADRTAVLYDDTGKVLAVMSGVVMIETSVIQILKALDNQKLSLPGMYEEAWRGRTGTWKNRTNMPAVSRPYLFSAEFRDKVNVWNDISYSRKRFKYLRAQLVYNYGLRALYDVGWTPPQDGGGVELTEFFERFGVLKSHDKLLTRILSIITEEGWLIRESKTRWRVATTSGTLPSESHVHQAIREIRTELSGEGKEGELLPPDAPPQEPDDVRVMSACGEALSKILTGRTSALSLLFPEDKDSDISADVFYNSTPLLLAGGMDMLKMVLSETFKIIPTLPEEERGMLRILEVGGGTGSSTKMFLQVLEEFGIKYHYTFSDISPAFFIRARQQFESFGKKISYKVLNIEEDPKTQGFAPETFDIVFGSNVIHATKDLGESVSNIRHLLRDSGLFMIIETFQPNRDIDLVFGVLEGFWRFTDLELRPEHPFIDGDKWCRVFRDAGHTSVQKFYTYDYMTGGVIAKAGDLLPLYKIPKHVTEKEKVWLVFGNESQFNSQLVPKFLKAGRKVISISAGNGYKMVDNVDKASGCRLSMRPSQKEDMMTLFAYLKSISTPVEGILYMWGLDEDQLGEVAPLSLAHPFLFLAQSLLDDYKGLPRLIVVTQGQIPVGDQSAVPPSSGVLWGMVRSFRSEHSNMFVRCVDLDPNEEDDILKYRELWGEVWNDDVDYQVAYRQRSRHVCRFVHNKDVLSPLPLPNSERFSLVLPQTRNIADLSFCAGGKPVLKEGEVEVQVKVLGLNFRDVFVVLKPDKAFDNYNTVGLEFSGVVASLGPGVDGVKVGDDVIGCNFRGDALPSHAICMWDALIPMPQGLTYHEAATLPAAFGTAYYCLVEVAALQKGETVLIHAGSGGVGLYAIQLAMALGAEVISTAGSRRKRAYLRGLGVKHVFHSRNTEYGAKIMEATGGKGIHVVLNCLTSPGFKEASLDACVVGARFVEISKMAIWSEEDVKKLRPDVKYWIIDLTQVATTTWRVLWEQLKAFFAKGFLKPIPYVRFDAQNIREALTYMQKAKHIGKILITMPELGGSGSRSTTDPKTNLFNDKSTYLITGGLGGIGLEVAKWMTESGAQHIVLASRREPNERAAKMIAELTGAGKHIVVESLDVGDYDQCHSLISRIQSGVLDNLPPLRGVMHAAGTLADAVYTNQTLASYETSFRGKVQGAWNLHRLTVELDCRLEHFVLYSSIVAIFGPIGLSNYAAANTFLDALAHYRIALGLTAQTINWGQWAEVGAAANIHITAIRAFTPAQGLAGLEAVMKSHKGQSCILEVDFGALKKLTGHATAYLEEMKITKDSDSMAFNIKIERFWEEYNSTGGDPDKQEEVIKAYVELILRQILKFDEDDVIDEDQNFSDMGMDSLMMLEMKNLMQTMLGKGVTMNVSAMQELTTVSKLVAHLKQVIATMGEEEERGPADYDTFSEELIALINKDLVLGEEYGPGAGVVLQPPIKRSQIRSVLLTGVTGKFGPFMLRSILARPGVNRVVCLIRSKAGAGRESGLSRLKGVLEYLDLLKDVDLSRVEVLDGDITEKHFGLSQSNWEALGERVDAVVHSAVKGNLMDPYTRFKDGSLASKGIDIRTVNVIGTLNVMELSVTGPSLKPFFFASTLLANQKTNPEDKTMWEDWYSGEDVFSLKNLGYPVSKFICEVLLHQLSDRGVPVGIYRFPALFGDSNSGRFSLLNNHAATRLLGFCKLGAIPAIPVPIQVIPSDVAADLAVEAFWRDDAPLGVYNVTNPHLSYFHDLPKASGEVGFPIEIVEWDVFSEKLSQNEEYRSLFPHSEVDMDEGRYTDFTTSPTALQAWIQNPEGYFPSKRLTGVFPNLRERIEPPLKTLKRDLEFAVNSGICAKFGIRRQMMTK